MNVAYVVLHSSVLQVFKWQNGPRAPIIILDLNDHHIRVESFKIEKFGDLLARAFPCSSCLSHVPLLSGYDEPTTLS